MTQAVICGSMCSSQTRLLSFRTCICFGHGEALSEILVLGQKHHCQKCTFMARPRLIGEMIPREVICEVWALHQHTQSRGLITWPTRRTNSSPSPPGWIAVSISVTQAWGYGLSVSLELCILERFKQGLREKSGTKVKAFHFLVQSRHVFSICSVTCLFSEHVTQIVIPLLSGFCSCSKTNCGALWGRHK